MTRIKLAFSLSLTVLFCCLWSSSIQAQVPELVVVNFVATEEQAESLALSTFFTLTDGNGRPIPQANVESATIQLLGPNNEPVPAIVEDPQTPVYIALLVDGSGSMGGVIGDVREAARSAIDSAPPTAYFSVIQFNETSTIIEDFTNDHNRVKSAIDIVESVPNNGTCLYDAVYDAIDLLDDQIQNPQERRAIILFTDGKDQITGDIPCSRHSFDDVINAARPANTSAPITPIHTIGLFDAQGGNLNEAELRSMASETIAYSAIGNQTNLGGLFQEIMDGLNSQLVARANVFAAQGENQAVLAVKVRGNDTPLTTTFNFFSNTSYDLPPPPVNVQFNNLQYDAVADIYRLSLGITSPESILQLIVNVWDVRRGTQVSSDLIFANPGPTLTIELDASGFEADREYSIRVQALDKDQFLITNEDEETILAESEITYEPPVIEAVEFTIQSVNADYVNGILIIDLDILDDGRIQTYDGFIVDEATGGKIHDFGPTPFTSRRIEETLPPAIQSAETALTYRVTVHLTTEDQLRSEAVYDEFKPVPPEPPGLMTRITQALGRNPVIFSSIVVIILAIIGWFVFQSRKEKKKAVPLPRPPVDKTNIFIPGASEHSANPAESQDWFAEDEEDLFPASVSSAKSSQAQLLLKVIRTQSQSLDQEKMIVNFPCTVGREDCAVNISGDGRISRVHMEIDVRGNEIFITDLGSSNGTFIEDKKLPPRTATPLVGSHIVRLGSQTHLELELLLA